jgi:hypothetical protein
VADTLAEVQLAQAVAGLTRLALDEPMTEIKDGPQFLNSLAREAEARREHAAGTLETISRLADEWAAAEPVVLPDPPLPPGFFGRVELPGRREYTGWITEGTSAGQAVRVVSDWDGRPLAEYQPGPNCLTVYLPTPLKRPEPQKAITYASHRFGDLDDDIDDLWHSAPEDEGQDDEQDDWHRPDCPNTGGDPEQCGCAQAVPF